MRGCRAAGGGTGVVVLHCLCLTRLSSWRQPQWGGETGLGEVEWSSSFSMLSSSSPGSGKTCVCWRRRRCSTTAQ